MKKDQTKSLLKKFSKSHKSLICLLLLVVVAVFSEFIFSDKMLYSPDQIGAFGSRVFYKDSAIEHGQFPLWLSCRLSGMPTVDALTGDAMYPPSIVIKSMFPYYRASTIIMILHVFLAGLFFYFLMFKGFAAPPLVAFAGALFYMLNPQFFSHIYPGHDSKMFVIAWIPFLVLRLKILMEEATFFNATLLALGIGMSVLTGHVQMVYFVLWGLFLYFLFALFFLRLKNNNTQSLLPAFIYFWVALFMGLGMSLIQLFPAFMYVQNGFSVRTVGKGFDYAASWSLHWPEIFSLWVPEFGNFLKNYWSENPFKLNSEYTGAIPLILAFFALIFKPGPWRLFWGVVGALALLFSMGAHTPLFDVAYYLIPGVKNFRACSMMMAWFSFSVVLLSTLFLQDIIKNNFSRLLYLQQRKWQKGLLIAVGVITILCLLFSSKDIVAFVMRGLTSSLENPHKIRIFEYNFAKNFVPHMWVWWCIMMITTGLLLCVLKQKINKYIFLMVVILIGLVDTIRIDAKFIKVVSPQPFIQTEPVLKDLQKEMKNEPFRCYFLPGAFGFKINNVAGIYGLEGISGFHDNELKWYRVFRGNHGNKNFLGGLIQKTIGGYKIGKGNNFLNIANAKYIVAQNRRGELVCIRNKEVLSRISFVDDYMVMAEGNILPALMKNLYDIRRTIALLEEPGSKPAIPGKTRQVSVGNKKGAFNVRWKTYTPNYRKAIVTADRDGFLRISEVYYPGWQIKVDGRPVKVYRADLAWMAISISKGKHIIETIPRSLFLREALFVSIPVSIFLLGYWIYRCYLGIRRKALLT